SSRKHDDTGPVDLTPGLEVAAAAFGAEGIAVALEYIDLTRASIHASPWGPFRRVEWVETAQLRDLFTSESLETRYGAFLDQRFIDYLDRNFDAADKMNWRKFEGLSRRILCAARLSLADRRRPRRWECRHSSVV